MTALPFNARQGLTLRIRNKIRKLNVCEDIQFHVVLYRDWTAEQSKFSPAFHSDVCGTVVHISEREGRFFRRASGLDVWQFTPSSLEWQLVGARSANPST